jgi:hypothetical protein
MFGKPPLVPRVHVHRHPIRVESRVVTTAVSSHENSYVKVQDMTKFVYEVLLVRSVNACYVMLRISATDN